MAASLPFKVAPKQDCTMSAMQQPGQQPDELSHANRKRKILICVTGLSPQIVTETLYAICVQQSPAWIPDEVRLITTARGAENARLMLLSENLGWFHRLLQDWKIPQISFDRSHIEIIQGSKGEPLDDIRDDEDNQRAANCISDLVRRLTEDENTEIHASIAGGRKTMGFFMGYAMSLWGRSQDKLSHVLVSSPFESRPEFYYPTPSPYVIVAAASGQDPLDASTAKVWLGDIPFVRLRSLLPANVTSARVDFAQAVAAANRALDQIDLEIDLASSDVRINAEASISLAPMQFALLTLFAWRRVNGKPPLRAPNNDTEGDKEWKNEVLDNLCKAMGEMHIPGKLYDRLAGQGDIVGTFEQQLSKLQKKLRDSGTLPAGDLFSRPHIHSRGRQRGYQLKLEPARIKIIARQQA